MDTFVGKTNYTSGGYFRSTENEQPTHELAPDITHAYRLVKEGNIDAVLQECVRLFWQGATPSLSSSNELQSQYQAVCDKYGPATAMFLLAHVYLAGSGIEQSDDEAVRCFIKANMLGNESALNSLHMLFLDGRGINEATSSQAFDFLTCRAAQERCPKAYYQLGLMYKTGDCPDRAEELFKLAADQKYGPAAFELAQIIEQKPVPAGSSAERFKSGQLKSSEHYYKIAADAGDRIAATRLANRYILGIQTSKVDPIKIYFGKEVVRYCKIAYPEKDELKAATQGIATYFYSLGRERRLGLVTEIQSPASSDKNDGQPAGAILNMGEQLLQAVVDPCISAVSNVVELANHFSLALATLQSRVMDGDKPLDFARTFFEYAAELGDAHSAFMLGWYNDEEHVGKFNSTALSYYQIAADAGHVEAKQQLRLKELYTEANRGNVDAMYEYARYFWDHPARDAAKEKRALDYFGRAAGANHPAALYILGELEWIESKTASIFTKSYLEGKAKSCLEKVASREPRAQQLLKEIDKASGKSAETAHPSRKDVDQFYEL